LSYRYESEIILIALYLQFPGKIAINGKNLHLATGRVAAGRGTGRVPLLCNREIAAGIPATTATVP
jgi:hypothetical protein